MRTSLREPIVRTVVKHPWITAGIAALLLGIGAATVVTSGVMPIRASSGHWPVTAILLDFAKVQSVKTYSLGIQPPPLDDYALVARGAAHYAVGCESCHGGPVSAVPPVMNAMTPPPPPLTAEQLGRWQPEHLFSIVKHGIKFTGMPAFPVQRRDDDVWAVVAFLRRMPGMDDAEYRRLVQPGRPPDVVRDVCWRCHGADGTGRYDGAFPSLAGQRAVYVEAALRAFAERRRFSATMTEVAARLSGTDVRELAVYFERLPGRAPAAQVDAGAVARGQALATQGLPGRDIPACVECHGPSAAPRDPAYPRLAGQHARYLALQLELLKQRRRGGSPRVNLMHAFVDRLDAAQIADVTRYYASIPGQELRGD